MVGVIGTPATVNSNAYARAINRYDPEIRVFSQACPLFVPLVEEGWLDHPVTRLTAQEYLKPVIAEHIDTLVLGCTHYPLLKPLLQEILGEGIRLVDSAEAMAAVTANLLSEKASPTPCASPPIPVLRDRRSLPLPDGRRTLPGKNPRQRGGRKITVNPGAVIFHQSVQ